MSEPTFTLRFYPVPKILYRLHRRLVTRGFKQGKWREFKPSLVTAFALMLVRWLIDTFECRELVKPEWPR